MFFALTPADGVVRVYPHTAMFALVLTLCVCYWLALIALFPGRQRWRLPHGVTCLAEVISFVAGEDCIRDEAFAGVAIRNKTSLVGMLGVDRRDEEKPRWTLHTGAGGARDDRLGVRRVQRFTGVGERGAAGLGVRDPAGVRLIEGSPSRGGRRRASIGVEGGEVAPLSPAATSYGEARREARRNERMMSPQYGSSSQRRQF